MKKFINKSLDDLIITDATSCIGGDFINFSKKFKFVHGVEINPKNFKLLVENSYDLNNIDLINDDYLNVYDKLHQDVVYIDPPWGGPSYKNYKSVNLKLSDIALSKLVGLLNNFTKYIFIKVPLNANLEGIDGVIKVVYNKYKRPSFALVCIKTK